MTNDSIALINFLDALSVHVIGRDLSSSNHEGAPAILLKTLTAKGVRGFKELCPECIEVLRLKNTASYWSENLTEKEAKKAKKSVEEIVKYVGQNIEEQRV